MSRYFGYWICGVCKDSPDHEGFSPPSDCPNCNEPRWLSGPEYQEELKDRAADMAISERLGK